jgi:hypothetical protein
MHFIVGQEIMHFCDDIVYGAGERTARAFFLVEGTMAALVKSKPCPVFFAVIESEERKILLVKNQVNTEIYVC